MTIAGCLLAGTALAAAMSPARADVTPAEAASLEAQMRTAIADLVGPSVTLPARPVQITAAGDHYDVVLPIGSGPAPAQVQATAKPGENGTWILDGVHLVTPATFTLKLPVPPPADAPPGTAPTLAPVTYTMDLKGQTGHLVWDPTFNSTASYTSSTEGMTLHATGPSPHDSTSGPASSSMTLQPAGPGRSTLMMEGTASDYRVTGAMGNQPLQVAIQKIGVKGGMTGADRAKAVQLVRAFATIIMAGAKAPPGQPPAPPPPELIRPVIDALSGLASDFTLDETVEGLATTVQGQAVGIETARLGMAAKADGGMVGGGLDLGMSGLTVPGFAGSPFAELVPKRVALHPYVLGLSVAALRTMADREMAGTEPTDADIATLFGAGGITAGLESMTLDIGGSVFSGSGKFVFAGMTPDKISGTARITADHLDALTQKLAAIPPLAQGVPVLLLAKGLGRAEGSTLVWDIVLKDQTVLVNNVDLKTMIPGGGSGAPAPAPAVPAPGGALKGPAPAPSGRTPLPAWAR